MPDTSRCIASAMPCVTRSTASRRSAATPASATPNSTAKTMTGSIAPSAAALITLGDTRSMNHCAIAGDEPTEAPALPCVAGRRPAQRHRRA